MGKRSENVNGILFGSHLTEEQYFARIFIEIEFKINVTWNWIKNASTNECDIFRINFFLSIIPCFTACFHFYYIRLWNPQCFWTKSWIVIAIFRSILRQSMVIVTWSENFMGTHLALKLANLYQFYIHVTILRFQFPSGNRTSQKPWYHMISVVSSFMPKQRHFKTRICKNIFIPE